MSMKKKVDGPKKKKEKLHFHEQRWTDTKKKKGRMHVHEQKWTDTKKKKKKINDKVTLSHVGKSMP